MAKAAMECVNGFNLFGEYGAAWTVVYADVDAHMRNKTVFEELIPRESSSKVCYIIRFVTLFVCYTQRLVSLFVCYTLRFVSLLYVILYGL